MNTQNTTNNTPVIKDNLESYGWTISSLGNFRSNGQLKEKTGFKLYVRRRNLNTFITNFSQKSSNSTPENAQFGDSSKMGSTPSMGSPECKMTPSQYPENTLPVLSSFQNYPSLTAIRKEGPCLLMGCDTEWEVTPSGRDIISWQFALVDEFDLVEFVFLKNGKENLSLTDALGCILDHLGSFKPVETRSVRKYKYCASWVDEKPVESVTTDSKEASSNCKYVYRKDIGFTKELIHDMPDKDAKRSERDWLHFCTYNDFKSLERIKITLICHAGMGDLTAFNYAKKNLCVFLTDIQGGLVTFRPVYYEAPSFQKVNNASIYPVALSVSDTMCHAPAGKKKLQDLGEVLGIEKVDISNNQKSMMKQFFADDPVKFMEYASTDSVITMLYASALYGYNNALPVTVTSATSSVMKNSIMNYLGCSSDEEFNLIYRGLEKVKHGMVKRNDKSGFIDASSLEPISDAANSVQFFASQAYHGGYNICSEVGHFPFDTYDYDLKNAYPTAMALIPDIDWSNPIKDEVNKRELTLEDFTDNNELNPIMPFVGYIRFKFPETCKYPCIPINVEGVPVYPLSSDGLNGVYVAGSCVWLALTLGAKVYCEKGYFLRTLYKDVNHESMSLAYSVKSLVADRDSAKQLNGKGSLEELILKTMVNSGYGKIAQNVIDKTTWNAFKDSMESLGCSSITNPVSAMMITSIVQVVLIAAQNQIQELGYSSYSVTTDGFISNCPEHILKNLDLYGLQKVMESSRIFLTEGNPDLWEIKHHQNDLVNITTRGNVSLLKNGVCAHNSLKSGEDSDSYKDRLWLMTKTLSRTSAVSYTDNVWPTFKEIIHGKPFIVRKEKKNIRMDFDMKRKPLKGSFRTDTISIEHIDYEMAHFDTAPFENVEEFQLYRAKKKLTEVLRNQTDWDLFWLKLDLNASGAQPRNMEWSILNSCIMGYRFGQWDIPGLNDKNVDGKCEWINSHNSSGKTFKPSDWKNARRPERHANMLPIDLIKDKLYELQNAIA